MIHSFNKCLSGAYCVIGPSNKMETRTDIILTLTGFMFGWEIAGIAALT